MGARVWLKVEWFEVLGARVSLMVEWFEVCAQGFDLRSNGSRFGPKGPI